MSIQSTILIVLFIVYNSVAILMLGEGTEITIVWMLDDEIERYNIAYQKSNNAKLPRDEGVIFTKNPADLPNELSNYFKKM